MKDQLQKAREALERAQTGLKWYRDAHPEDDSGADDEMDAEIEGAITALAQLEAMVVEQKPCAWHVCSVNSDGALSLEHAAAWEEAAHEHINDAITEHGIEEAASWVVRPVVYAAPVAQQPQAELQRYSLDGEGGMETDSLGAWVKLRDVKQQPQAEPITEALIDAYLEDYEMRSETEDGQDACYTPSEGEKSLIKDAIMGLLAEIPPKQPQAEAVPDVRNLISQLENAAHNKGELFERHQGKGWPATASERFTRLRDETIPALRKQLLAAIAQQKGEAVPPTHVLVAWVERDGELVWNNREAAIGKNLYTATPEAPQTEDHLKQHAIEELCQLGYTVIHGELFPPDHLHKLMEAAGHPLAAAIAQQKGGV